MQGTGERVTGISQKLMRDGRRASTALRESELRALLFVGDVIAASVAVVVAPELWALVDPTFAPRVDLRVVELTFVLVWVLLLRLLGRSDIATPRLGWRTLSAVARTLFASVVLVFVLFFFAPFFAPRSSTVVTLPLLAVATLAWRYGFLRLLGGNVFERHVAIVGTDEAARRTAAAMRASDGPLRYDIVAFLTSVSEDEGAILGAPVVTLNDKPWITIRDLGVDLLVVGRTRSAPTSLLAELTRCFEHGVEAIPATVLYEQVTGRVLAAALEADWYAELPTNAHGLYIPLKRIVDLLLSIPVCVLGVIAAPFVALAIVVDSGMPVLYRQVRVGLRGEPFVLHKFRTMYTDAESNGEPRWSSPGDPRITRVGRFLRRTRLDELPQLWDVLRGRMSLIGPRPERPEFVERLAQELPLYRARSLVRPGISGWAQVQYPYAASVEENLAKLEFDLYYVRHIGPMLDATIVLRTIHRILSLGGR